MVNPPDPNPASRRPQATPGGGDVPSPENVPPGRGGAAASARTDASGALTHWKGFTLSGFQRKAVAAVREEKNVLVAAPTGAGKTLVAEYAMEDAVKRGKRCIYTSPIKALSNQKYRDFRDDPEVDVGIMTGDVTISAGAQVLIMTTEILRNAMFENPELLAHVEYVIFDEIHYMDDRERGSVWEESLIFLPPGVRLICLSATVANVDELGAWLDEIRPQEIEIVRSQKRPVPLSHWGWTEKGGPFDVAKIDHIRKLEERSGGGRSRGSRGSRGRRGGRRGRGRGRGQDGDGPPDPTSLFTRLEDEGLLPALVFSFSRKDVERLARWNSKRRLLTPDEEERMDTLQSEMIELFQLLPGERNGELFKMARGGVAFHHAGMLPVHKEVVERMFTEGLLKLLFTTETFALGINMPARSVVFQSLRKFDGISFDYLRTRDYMQMAGRAGRQGIDDKGFVYSVLDSRGLSEAPMKRLVAGSPEPVVSRFRLSYATLLFLVERLGRERVFEAWDKSFARFQTRSKNKKGREKEARQQQRTVDAHLAFLDELNYLEGDEVTRRGALARLFAGYEVQVTELLFRGTIENLPPRALALVFSGLIYEERRRHDRPWVPARIYGNLRHAVDDVLSELGSREVRHGIGPGLKRADWGLSKATLAWYDGATMEELEDETGAIPGDACRVFRMAIQLMRNVRHAIDPDWDLADSLREACRQMNRDEVDARRQLELG